MNPEAATFWTGIACLILGWVAFWALVHRSDKANQRAIHADALAAKDEQHDEDTARLAAEFSRLLDRADQAARDAMADVDLLRGVR